MSALSDEQSCIFRQKERKSEESAKKVGLFVAMTQSVNVQ